jgi:cold shock protein
MTSDERSGTVAFFDAAKGFGFIVPDGTSPSERDRHLFVHANAIQRSGLETLTKGQRVAFRIQEPFRPGKKHEAQDLRLLDEAA